MSPEIIAGRYRVERAAGRGGMGTVWLCRDEVLGRDVAVKEVGVFPGESVPDLARALREARSSAVLNHPHVVSVYDVVEADDQIWLVMEFVPGTTLAELIAREGRVDPARVAAIGAQVADGLAAAHARGTVHRDVKPGNVLVDGDTAKISDFGIARTDGDAQLTRSGLVTGTPLYFSPELARGEDATPASDVWALGATLYAAVEGTAPIADRGNAIATLTAIAGGRPALPEHAGFLRDAIGRMLDPDPQSRWSMADAAHALQRLHRQHRPPGTLETTAPVAAAIVPDDPGVVEPVTPPERQGVSARPVATSPRRRSRGPLLVAGAVVLLLAVIVTAVLLGRPDDSADVSAPGAPDSSRSPRAEKPDPTTSAPTEPETTATASAEPSVTPPAPAESAGSAEQTVVDYYALLPDDTEAAWEFLGPKAQDSAGGYGGYSGFWEGVDSVTVDGTRRDGDLVLVDLTYNGDDPETRQLVVTRAGDGWQISEDRGPL
ncbi:MULTISPECIES: serine/threonine-protein kinase [unclassified Nocardioides]|uniref:serine/threonine-protein kinase n=1 Tax=unclassified Nocardioides TaxID=2615069 RepID=UPI0009F03A71|nr:MULTISPECIES: serine/threonine-protein kinase [unclassified Nocardioides]GAW51191.1 Putative serine/threonine protein kinase [Nocardioides sp. PD653-B2]GAW56919.1 putative serine/threonine protein kinase [Nocardioides sp. PD653]